MTITDFSDERAAKRAAIRKARNTPKSTSLMASRDTGTKDRSRAEDYQ